MDLPAEFGIFSNRVGGSGGPGIQSFCCSQGAPKLHMRGRYGREIFENLCLEK